MRKILNTTVQPIITYSQNKEDIILASLFKDVEDGFYVDIGAAHPEYLSVTKYFYTRGWSGINAEPNQRLFDLVTQHRPRDKTYRFAISDSEQKTVQFREYLGDGLSTLSSKMKQEYDVSASAGTRYYRDYDVPTISLATLLAKDNPEVIHFMKVDVEGFEYEVLKSNDWSKYRPRIICVEANHVDRDWGTFVSDNNYQRVFHDGLNDYYADMNFYDTVPTVDYNVIYNPRIVTPIWAEAIDTYQRQLQDMQGELTRVTDELKTRPTVDGEGMRFRVVGKVLLKKIDAVIVGQLAPAPISQATTKTEEVAHDQTELYDKEVWNIQASDVPSTPSLARRGVFKMYRGLKKGVKTVVKRKGTM